MCKTKAELDCLIEKLRKIRALKDKLNKREQNIKDDIIEYVLAHGVIDDSKKSKPIIVIGDSYVVAYGDRSKSDPDVDKLKQYFGDEYSNFVKNITYKQLNIK